MMQGIVFLEVIHSDTKHGRILVDAHFSVAMRQVVRCMNERHNVQFEEQLVQASRFHEGVSNSVVELVFPNRQQLHEYEEQFAATQKHFGSVVGRYSEAIFCDDVAEGFQFSPIECSSALAL